MKNVVVWFMQLAVLPSTITYGKLLMFESSLSCACRMNAQQRPLDSRCMSPLPMINTLISLNDSPTSLDE